GAASVGEVGDTEALPLMIEYTAGNKRLNMTYSFAFLNEQRSATYIKRHATEFETANAQAAADSWPCWTIGNHDAQRVLTRWEGHHAPDDFVRLHLAMLCSLRGSVCWYQGDELGLHEADIPLEHLQDPRGIAFWPEDKGRDGCRTPMPWDYDEPSAGFSGGKHVKPWLPIPAQHVRHAVSAVEANPQAALHFVRAFLQWRKQDLSLVRGDIRFLAGSSEVLAFVRSPRTGDSAPTWLCVFNLAGHEVRMDLADAPASSVYALPQLPAAQMGARLDKAFVLPAYGIYWGTVSV
ncbi:MAG: alpha-glucosidase, partial [Rhodoferax sp.]|nr:alpha-glucosidase [Rhodoferax sp.]